MSAGPTPNQSLKCVLFCVHAKIIDIDVDVDGVVEEDNLSKDVDVDGGVAM